MPDEIIRAEPVTRDDPRPCSWCNATGWNGGKAGTGECKRCEGSGYIERRLVDTPRNLIKALRDIGND